MMDGIKDGEGKGYPWTSEDSYGKVTTIKYEDTKNADPRGGGVIIRKPDWSAKDIEFDRFIDLAYANNEGVIDAYLVQGDSNIVFREEDAITSPEILLAKIDSLNEISFTLNGKVSEEDREDKILLKETKSGNIVDIDSFIILDSLLGGKIITKNNLDISKGYTLSIEGFSEKEITLGKIYGSQDFADRYHYDGQLGAIYSKNKTSFVLWAPTATKVSLALFNSSDYINDKSFKEVVEMTKGENGIWTIDKQGDLNGLYYKYLVEVNGEENEVTDPYAKAVGVNGIRAMVIDLNETNPEGWSNDVKPEFIDPTDAIIYEMHIRDFSIDESSGSSIEVRGKYNGVWQEGNTLPGNSDVKTGVDHLKELGVTHLHLLPTFDHRSINETKLNEEQYNWGYDPQNYNVPEGSYSSDPYKAEIRIKEFKELIMELHKAGIRVVMDVVYNHTGASADSHLNKAVPDYYYRQNEEGGFSNGSGCGNELASENSMVRKMMVDSLVFWAEEYHIDGFRFDLMGLHDIKTMKEIRTSLDKVDESILLYGEGWTGGDSPLPANEQAVKANTKEYGDMQIAAFSDDSRDGIKGHVFEEETPGFVNGYDGLEELIKFGIVGSVKHDQIIYGENPNQYNGYGKEPWANEPYQTVNYASAHDNLTLWDKLQSTNPDVSEDELKLMNKMSAAIVLTSQGIPFFQGGEEFLRTKQHQDGTFEENSYNKPDNINKLDWTRKEKYNDVFNYYKGLIELRKSHKSFRMNTATDIQNGIEFLENGKEFNGENVVGYVIDGEITNDSWENIAVLFNANKDEVEITLPSENWTIVVNENKAGVEELGTVSGDKVIVPGNTSYVLVDSESFNKEPSIDEEIPEVPETPEINNKPIIEGAKSKQIKIGEKFDPLKGIAASDKEDGDLTSKIKVEGTVNTKKEGKYNVTYSVSDSNYNEAETTVTITVKGKKLPYTGGVSTKVLVIIGLLMSGTGAYILVRKKKIIWPDIYIKEIFNYTYKLDRIKMFKFISIFLWKEEIIILK